MITFDHVTYTYEGRTEPCLRGCSFSVKPGELILFTGERWGAARPPSSSSSTGCSSIAEAELWKAPSQWAAGMWPERPCGSWRKTVGSVFQNPKSQFFNLDTTGEVLFGLESRGASREEMSQALDSAVQICGVGPLLDRNIFALSGGEKQRIACASAWAMGPEVFVLDEPSSNLDGEGIRQLRDILRRLKAAGKNRPGGRAPSVVRCRPG